MSSIETPVICIDGPSGSGKGTLSKLLAETLGFHLLDSGALYRVTAIAAKQKQVDWHDESAVAKVARDLDIEFSLREKGVSVILEGDDVTKAIRSEEGSLGSSIVAALPAVRDALLELQRDFGKSPGLIADGRDMGTTVFPNAAAKFYLTASAEERAKRRHQQLLDRGESASLRALLEAIEARDERDSQRAASPLKPADDAIEVDSTAMSIQEVLDFMLATLADKGIG